MKSKRFWRGMSLTVGISMTIEALTFGYDHHFFDHAYIALAAMLISTALLPPWVDS